MKTFRWKVKPDMEVNSQPSVREVRFGDGYSQRMAAGLNADLKTYRVTLSVTREEAARAGLAASAIAMEGAETINPALNACAVRARAGL